MVRNLILNWLVILPVVVLLVLGLKLLLVITGYLAQIPPDRCWPSILLLIVGAAALVWALRFSTRNRPTRQFIARGQPGMKLAGQAQVMSQYVPPALISAILISLAAVTACAASKLGSLGVVSLIAIGACFGLLVYLLAWLAAGVKRDTGDLVRWVISGAVYGIFLSLGALLYFQAAGSLGVLSFFKLPVILLLVVGIPWVIISQLIAEMVFVGLSSGEPNSDGDREWFGRAGGFLLFISLAWLVLMFLVFVGSNLVGEAFPKLKSTIIGAGGLSGLITAFLGKSRLTPAKGPARGGKQVSANLVLAIAAAVFAITLLLGLSWLLDFIMFRQALSETDAMRQQVAWGDWPPVPYEIWWILVAAIIAILVGVIASKNVNINRFSLHALYRNRLIRTYLGASNDRDDPLAGPPDMNPFTRFAQSDNPRMHELWPHIAATSDAATKRNNWRPFHVVNMTLNIASTKRLAWQERKAEPFTVTPRHSGSSCKGFRTSETYGDERGISLGTAVAISGAAASPSMGYHSSAPLSLLLAFFNVRLGWWLGNPGAEGAKTFDDEGPQFAVAPFLRELFGKTTDDYKYVYLSDGGHFENLGLYEMVRRRCRVIVVSDAGADEAYAFADLGNAVRKIAIDLGVSITFPEGGLQKLRRRPADGPDLGTITGADAPLRYAVGIIHYSQADGSDSKDGVLLYIKPSYFGSEGAGVRNYAITHPQFPHEGTLDQWFSESQLESYRALGFEIMDEVLARAAAALPQPTNEFGDLVRALLR
jgi:hypothetical protein